MLIPPKLQPGDTVGLITPSYPTPSFHPERLKKGIEVLEKEFGLKVQLGLSVEKRHGHLAGTNQERADDINRFFASPSIKALWCTSGGYNSNGLLPLLDYKTIVQNPKIVIGYSDATALLLGLYYRAGLVGFHGPTICREFGGFPMTFPYTIEQCKKALFQTTPIGKLQPPEEWTSDNPADLIGGISPTMMPATPWRWLRHGSAKGKLIGGNLQSLLVLHGTQYWPDFEDAIFFWEEVDIHMAQVHRHLTECRMIGLFDKIAGMVIGQPKLRTLESALSLEEVIQDVTQGYNFPILADVDCSHTDPMLTFPIGVQATLNSYQHLFSIDQAGVK